jgi:hypothetical protein
MDKTMINILDLSESYIQEVTTSETLVVLGGALVNLNINVAVPTIVQVSVFGGGNYAWSYIGQGASPNRR